MDHINRIVENGADVEPVYAKKKGLIPMRRAGDLIFVSGHGPENPLTAEPLYVGRVGEDLTPEEGYAAAKQCALLILGALKDNLGSLDMVERVLKVFAFVNCGEGFNDINGVMDGFSDTIVSVLDERGLHARTVVGTRNLPNRNMPVEVEIIVSVRP